MSHIIGNGHDVHYDSSLAGNSYLGGLTYSLVNGGVLTPGAMDLAEAHTAALPVTRLLGQTCPNPFGRTTGIAFEVTRRCRLTLTVSDLAGRQVSVLVDEERDAGSYVVQFDASGLASGVYVASLVAGGNHETTRIVVRR